MNRKTHTALVTGGTRGIGRAICWQLHGEGYQVIASFSSNHDAATRFSEETGITALKFDVGNYEKTLEAVTAIERDWGGIDILVNNAGITRDGMFHRMSVDAWNQVIQTNLTSCFNTCQAVIAGMRDRGYGRIVNITSLNGQKGQVGQTNYAAAKAGIIGFTKALALETASRGITVNAVAPGYIDTDMCRNVPAETLDKMISHIPTGRMGQVSEVARAVSFLVDPENSFMTGATLSVNGGQLMV